MLIKNDRYEFRLSIAACESHSLTRNQKSYILP
jgi:hypothetical protein